MHAWGARGLALAVAAFGCALPMLPAAAAVVSVKAVAATAGGAEDTVVVFEPLDAVPPAARGAAVIDQVHKTFKPRVTVVRTGTVVSFPNSDNIHHEVYSFSPPKPFKLPMYANEPHEPVIFDKPGIVLLGCNIHDQMVAFVVVVDSPYFVKLPATGQADTSLPSGRYRVRIWNENLKSSAIPATLSVGHDPLTLEVQLDQPRENPEHWVD